MLESKADTATTISTHNLYALVTQLCRCLYKQHNAGNKTNNESEHAIVNKLKAIAFAIILKKCQNAHCYAEPDEDAAAKAYNAERALCQHIFAAKLHFRKNEKALQQYLDFEQRMLQLQQQDFFGSNLASGVVQFLLALHEQLYGSYAPDPHVAASELLVPGPFTLHANYEHNIYYPQNNWNTINDCKPRYFKGVRDMCSSYEPYKPKFFAATEDNQLMAMERKYGAIGKTNEDTNADDCTFTGMARRLCGSNMRINTAAFSLFDSDHEEARTECIAITKQPQREPQQSAADVHEQAASEAARIYSWNWESLGCFGIPLAKPFITETTATLALQCLHNQSQQRAFVAKILTTKQFLKDLKCLTVGIRSDTFQYDELMVFSMQPNITVENVLPETIENYVKAFLLCGTCYKRMQTMIMKRDYKLMFEGFIFKALCSAVDEYLLTFRQLVYATEDTHLLSFYSRMQHMLKQIDNLSFTLAIHPHVISSVAPPLGSQFLGYIYREIMRITDKQYLMLLIFILKRCCHVYFKHLQKWIFYGLLDDPSNELFVGFVDHYRPNTKYFYDRAYFLRKESVPGFFQSHEDSILLCGKYTMLLKACKPHHPLFELEYPSISVCLSFEELQALQLNCTKYYERARELCGKPITIRDLFAARQEQKRHFKHYVQQKSKERMCKWLAEQQEQKHEAAERKKLIFEELRTQMEDAQQRKRDERRANVERELFMLRSYEQREEELLKVEHTNLRKRLEYYQELSDSLDDAECSSRSRANLKEELPPLRRVNTPNTPNSTHTDGSSFKSCSLAREKAADEDSSDYVECLSEDFLNDFGDIGEQLLDLQHDHDFVSVSDDVMAEGYLREHKAWTEAQHLRSDLQKNRAHILSGSAMEDCLQPSIKAAQLKHQKRPITPPASRQPNAAHSSSPKQLSKALAKSLPDINCNVPPVAELTTSLQQNRQRMMASRIGAAAPCSVQDQLNSNVPATATIQVNGSAYADINLNVVVMSSDTVLTAMERNRQRMMDTDLFAALDKDPACERAQLKLNLNTELARNRQRVLNSEYGIVLAPSTHSLQVESVEHAATPMSTTSDTPLTECEPTSGQLDAANGNKAEELKLTVHMLGSGDGVATASSLCAETPECALNTAGIAARNGFDFSDGVPNTQTLHVNAASEKLPSIAEAPIVTPTSATDLEHSRTAQPPYQRTLELMESNFQCPARSPLIRLNKQCSTDTLGTQHADNNNSPHMNTSKRICLQNMSAITITEFLQKSVIIPMSTHLELVNNEVMRMFLDDLRLIDHLRSLRNYFFLMDGEFGLIICDGIIAKLEDGYTPVKLLNYQMLHSILDNALGYSIAGNQKNAENLSFIVQDIPESFDLCSPHVLANLCLSYRIQWPLNLILNPETLEQYANIFKYLLSVRRISFVLDRAFQILKEAIKQHGKAILRSPQYRHIQQIRHKLYNFVHALQNHITASALQASWKTFKDELLKANSIEDIYRKHTAYIKRILFLCMLNRSSIEFYNAVENIFKITLRFHKNLKSREFKLRTGDQYLTHGRYDKLVKDELEFDKFIKYTIYLGNKIVRHGYQEEIGEFINLINFNNYYTPSNIK